MAAQIVTGVGFIGAGTILASREGRVRGLTTATSIWIAAGLGMAAGAGMYVLSLVASLVTAVIPSLAR